MKTVIYWFSATGNSLQAARLLARGLGEGTELRPIVGELAAAGPAGRIGVPVGTGHVVLVFPLYYLSWPVVVEEFLGRLDLPASVDASAVVTRGMFLMGGVMSDLDSWLRRRGSRLRLGRYLELPNNDVILFNACPAGKSSRKLARLDAAAGRVAAAIASGRYGRSPELFGFMKVFRYPIYQNKITTSHRHFLADAACTGCGLCARLCPLGRIAMADGRPAWSAGCQEC
jgi:NAD-dependent dihydropyrimidine dehydrogenase PreA subunit